MQQTLYFKTYQSSNEFLLSYPTAKMPTSLHNTAIFAPKFFFIRSSILASHPTQIRNPIICARKTDKLVIYARKNRRRNGYQISKKLLFGLIAIMASKIKILPQPLDLVVEEIGLVDGNGGAAWFWKLFGGGFNGRRSKKKRNSMLLVFFVICGLAFLLGKELERNLLCGFSVLGLLGVLWIQWLGNRKTKDWVLGFCLGGVLVGMGLLRRGGMRKWVERLRVCSPVMEVGRRRGRK